MRSLIGLVLVGGVLAAQAVSFRVDSAWGTGYQATVIIQNTSGVAIAGWTLAFDAPDPIQSLWDGRLALAGQRATVQDAGWNGAIPAGGSASFGYTATGATPQPPRAACLNGQPIAVNGVPSTSNCPGTPPPPPSGGGLLQEVTANPSGRRIIGYYTAWSIYARSYEVDAIPADQLTHINYAFANIGADLRIALGDPWADIDRRWPNAPTTPGTLYGNFGRLQRLKARHPHLQTLISVGGWTWSSRFSDVALTAQSRSVFAASCVQFVRDYGFDGVDIDWEYPVSGGLPGNTTRAVDRQNYTLLLAELRSQLDAAGQVDGRRYLLTIAAPAGPATFANLELGQIHAHLDWINLMAYDFHGSWSPFTHFNAALGAVSNDPSADPVARTAFNVRSAVLSYLAAGVPADKLVLGVPFYGRGFAGVPNVNQGLFQPFTGTAAGTWEPAVFDWKDLRARLVPTMTRSWHPEAEVPWLYSPSSGVMISYDDPMSIGRKADLILQQSLGGAMAWELSADDPQQSLLGVLADRLLAPVPYLSLGTSGGGAGDLVLGLTGMPSAASFGIVLASATPAPGGLGTGPLLGLSVDPLVQAMIAWPAAPNSPLHFPRTASPYGNGPLRWPAGTFGVGAGTTFEVIGVGYDPLSGFLQPTAVLPLRW